MSLLPISPHVPSCCFLPVSEDFLVLLPLALLSLYFPANAPLTPEFPRWLIPSSAPSYLKFKPRRPLFLPGTPVHRFFSPVLMAANTQSWWLTDLRLKSCPLLKVYSYASDWPLAIFAWNSSQCLRFSSWACPLPHRSQFPFPVPSSCPAVLVSESSPLQTLKSSPKCLSGLSLLTWRFSPSCWTRHVCWFLSSKFLLPPWVSISFLVSSS